jgi:hypothetical protein
VLVLADLLYPPETRSDRGSSGAIRYAALVVAGAVFFLRHPCSVPRCRASTCDVR